MPWQIKDIAFNQIAKERALADDDLIILLCACSFIESGSDLYTRNLSSYFAGDAEVENWLNNYWECEELQHGQALRQYLAHVWPDFNWQQAFSEFFKEYALTCRIETFEKTRALEMVARCVVETGTATLYRAINQCCNEPILKQLTDLIRIDEVRHYKNFYRFFKKYNEIEKNSRWQIFKALLRRIKELENEDSAIALRHVYQHRYPEKKFDAIKFHETSQRISRLIKKNLSAEMCIKMLIKPLRLPARIQLKIEMPLAKITQRIFFR